MNFFRLLPVVISLLLIVAHYLREGQTAIVAIVLLLPLLLFLKKFWVPWIIQAVLLLGALEWLLTLVAIARFRMIQGESWTRMAIILGAVTLFTALSSLVFRSSALKARYSGKM
jgi:signal transduction histidine kinase